MDDTVFARYTRYLLGGTALLMLATVTFNRVIDPFNYFGDINISGLNAVRTQMYLFEREVKPVVLHKKQPESVILGSSIADIGFDPRHPKLTANGKAAGYNFGFLNASWRENLCALEYIFRNTDAKRVVLGVSLSEAMPDEDCTQATEKMEAKHWTTWLDRWATLLVSPQATTHSFKTMRNQTLDARPTHTPEGRYLVHHDDYAGEEERVAREFLAGVPADGSCSMDRLRGSLNEPPPSLDEGGARPLDLGGLDRILKRIAGRDVKLKIVIYPQHLLSMEVEYLCRRATTRWQALYQIARYLEQHPPAPPASVEIWDFQGYSPDFTEPLGARARGLWLDLIHFRAELGDRMLDTMFAGASGDADPVTGFGYRVTTASLAERYRWFSEQRTAYLKEHAAAWDELARLLPPGR
jgi:hypothetical protein